MLNYIAKDKVRDAIQKVCKDNNVLILYETYYSVNIEEYIKKTNVNFNVIRYFVIDVNCILDINNLSKINRHIKKQVRIFDKKEQEKILKKKENKKKLKFKTKNLINFVIKGNTHKSNNVYFFLLEFITKIVNLIIGILFFILTRIGITVLFNEQLRNLLMQIFNN